MNQLCAVNFLFLLQSKNLDSHLNKMKKIVVAKRRTKLSLEEEWRSIWKEMSEIGGSGSEQKGCVKRKEKAV